MSESSKNYNSTKEKWCNFKSNPNNEKIRIRDAAKQLSCSEAELLSTEVDGSNIKFLFIENFNIFFKDLLKIDKIMFLIRTDSVVHEKIVMTSSLRYTENKFYDIEDESPVLLFNYEVIMFSFYERKQHGKKFLRSFQFFDINGDSVIKIYLKSKNELKFDALSNKYVISYNFEVQDKVDKMMKSTSSKANNWVNQYNLFDDYYSSKFVNKTLLRKIFEEVSKASFPISIYCIVDKVIQFHNGLIKNIVDFGPWLNIIDKTFNIHAMENKIDKNHLFTYNYDENIYYSIEFFDVNNLHVLGIRACSGFEEDFNKILIKIGVIDEI